MTSTPSLYRQAVAYAVSRLEVGADRQKIEQDLLNLPQFTALWATLETVPAADCLADILADADAENEARLMRNIQPQEDQP